MESLECEELDYEDYYQPEVSSDSSCHVVANITKDNTIINEKEVTITSLSFSSGSSPSIVTHSREAASGSATSSLFSRYDEENTRSSLHLEDPANSGITFPKEQYSVLTNTVPLGSKFDSPHTSTASFNENSADQKNPKVLLDLSRLSIGYESESELSEAPSITHQTNITINSQYPNGFASCLSDKPYHLSSRYSKPPHSILARKQKKLTDNDEVIEKCMDLLCNIPSTSQLLLCAKEVFKNACFTEIFQGECLNSSCWDDHHFIPNFLNFNQSTLWNASLYVICHSSKPKILIVKKLVQFFSEKGDMIKTLMFSKCIAKLGDAEKWEFAQYLVNSMTGPVERKHAVTRVLSLSYADLDSNVFNVIMEDMGVFEQDSTQYFELISFLAYRSHNFPGRLLVKLLEHAIKYCSTPDSNGVADDIVKFLKQLSLSDLAKIESVATQFMDLFQFDFSWYVDIKERQTDPSRINLYSQEVGSIQKCAIKTAKKVKFADVVNVIQFLDPDLSEVADNSTQDLFSGMNAPMDVEPNPLRNKKTISEDYLSCIFYVLENSCLDWILTSECLKSDCTLLHRFDKTLFTHKSLEKVLLAAEFIIENATRPKFEILRALIEFVSDTNDVWIMLSFRKCASKLSSTDSLKLTRLVLSRLTRHTDRWEAVERVLAPQVLDFGKKSVDRFQFDKNLLNAVMTEALHKKSYLSKCTAHEISRRVSQLPTEERENILETTVAFVRKFILKRGDIQLCPELIPMNTLQITNFSSQIKIELHNGVSNKYFVVCVMLKYAIEKAIIEVASDSLYTFLLTNYARARILDIMLENCNFFRAPSRKEVTQLLGRVGLSVGVRLFEHENFAAASDIFEVLRKFKFNFFEIQPICFHISHLNLALIYCSSSVGRDAGVVDIFLEHCLQAFLDSDVSLSSVPSELMTVTNKMFVTLSEGSFAEETLALFNGIFSRQKSLLFPLDILKYQERTLRSALGVPWNRNVRHSCLKLFLDVVCTSDQQINLQKVTMRSVFILGLKEIYSYYRKFRSKGLPNLLHPVIKKLFISCIKVDAYPKFPSTCDQITLYSSMSEGEIQSYLFWWIYYLVRSRKQHQIDYFEPVTVNIVQDNLQDELRLPIHFTLQNVDCNIAACAERTFTVIKSLISDPLPISGFKNKSRGTYEMSEEIVRAMTQQVLNCLFLHNSPSNSGSIRRLCTFTFDERDIAFHQIPKP